MALRAECDRLLRKVLIMLRTSNLPSRRSRLFFRSLPLWCALAAACAGASGCESPNWQLGENATLTATIDDWHPTSKDHLEVGVAYPRADGGSADFFKLTTAEIGPDGTFHVALPDAAAIAPHLETWDPSVLDPSRESKNEVQIHSSVDTPGVRGAVLSFKITDGNGYQYLLTQSMILQGDGRVWGISFRWADRDVQISGSKEGSLVSPTSRINWKTTFDLQLAPGWNRTMLDTTLETHDGQRFDNTLFQTTSEIPAAVRWTYIHGSN